MIYEDVKKAERFLKSLASQHRLFILCKLAEKGEMSVTEIMSETGLKQTSVSQHLARLKQSGIVSFRRQHRILYYYIYSQTAEDVMSILYETFCKSQELSDEK